MGDPANQAPVVSKMADAVIEANQGAEMTAEEAESAEANAAEEA